MSALIKMIMVVLTLYLHIFILFSSLGPAKGNELCSDISAGRGLSIGHDCSIAGGFSL
jgi:hypothetical protein